jgi:hypothetical protein
MLDEFKWTSRYKTLSKYNKHKFNIELTNINNTKYKGCYYKNNGFYIKLVINDYYDDCNKKNKK